MSSVIRVMAAIKVLNLSGVKMSSVGLNWCTFSGLSLELKYTCTYGVVL